jgi:tyrosinase
MKLFAISLAYLIVSIASATSPGDTEALAKARMQKLAENALNITLQGLDADVAAAKALGLKPNCTRETLLFRKEL